MTKYGDGLQSLVTARLKKQIHSMHTSVRDISKVVFITLHLGLQIR